MLLEWLYVLLVVVSAVVTEYCPPNNSTGDPHFTKTPAGQDDFTLNTAGRLFCCVTGVDSILWERKGQGWELYPWGDSDNMELKNRNQTLQIMSFSMQYDTLFMCSLIKDGTVVKKHSMRIYVHSCVSTRGPMLIMPFPEDKTIEKLGVTIKLYCTGYFGCDSSFDPKIVEWFVKDTNSNGMGDKIRGNDTHYSMTTRYSVEGSKSISSLLTIHGVQAIDLQRQRQFVCRVSSAQSIQKNNIKQVSISLIEIPDYKSYIICISVGVVFILVLIGIVYRCCGPQIRLTLSSRIALLAPKPITVEQFDYNVFMYVANGDQKQGQLIVKKLKDYKVFTTTQVEGNQAELASYANECEKAAIVFFLYSKILLEDDVADYICQGLIKDRKRIILVEIDNSVDNKALNKKFWTSLPKYKLPSEDSSGRKKSHFWCSLKNKIPKFEH